MSGVAEMYHRARRRVETYERELARCEVESHKRDFYRRTILGATGGKLLITERQDIDGIAGALLGSWHVGSLDDVSKVRDEITSIARRADMDESRTNELKGCVVEAAGNALKHAGGGDAALYAMDDGLLFVVSDSGPGIGTMELPDVALTKGYSTAGTLGMGYKLMIEFADKVHLFTGTEGTTVAVEVAKHKKPTWPDDVVLRQVTDWKD
jgi:anti-sigma regulatory factor (Ser/Thr protein kinase)